MASQLSSQPTKKEIVIDLTVNNKAAMDNVIAASKAIDELKQQQKDLAKQYKEGAISADEYYKELAKIKTQINDNKDTLKANQKILDENVKAYGKNEESLNAMRAQLKLLRAEYEDLSRTDREGAKGEETLNQINKLTDEVLKLEKAQQDYTRQVGNYELAAKPVVAVLKEMKNDCRNLAVELIKLKGAQEAQQAVVNNLAETTGTETQEYKEAVAELDRLNQAYTTTNAKLVDLEQETGKLADTLADSNKRIASFANDQQKIAAAQEGVNALSAAYDSLNGALAMAGIKSEAMVEIYSKMQIVQRSLNGVMTIYKALNKDSNLMITIRTKLEQTRLKWTQAYNAALAKQTAAKTAETAAETTNTAAMSANTAATVSNTVAEGAATTATFSLRAAFEALKVTLMSNPITLIALAITSAVALIIGAVSKFKKAEEEAAEAEKAHEEEMKQEEEKIKSLTETYKASAKERANAASSVTKKYEEEIAKIKALVAVTRNEAAAYLDKKKALAELNKLIPNYNGQLDKTGKLIKGNISAIDAYIAKLKEKAKAEAVTEMLIQSYLKQTELERTKLRLNQDITQETANYEEYMRQYNAALASGNAELANSIQEKWKATAETLEAARRSLQQIDEEIIQANKDVKAAEQIATSVTNIDFTSNKPTTGKKDNLLERAKAQYTEMLKIAEQYYKSIDDLEKEAIKTQVDRENARYAGEREQLEKAIYDATQLYEQLSKSPELLKKFKAENKGFNLDVLANQIKILNTELDNSATRHADNLEKIKVETEEAFVKVTTTLRADVEKTQANLTALYKMQLKEKIEAINEEERIELESHAYTEEQKLEISRLYEEKRKQIIAESSKVDVTSYENINSVKQLHEQVKQDLAAIDAAEQAALANWIGTEEEKTALLEEFSKRRVQISKNEATQETKLWIQSSMQIAGALSNALGSLSNMFNEIAEDDEKMQNYSKQLAMGQIILSSAVGTAQAVVAAINAGKDTGIGAAIAIPVFVAEFIGIVASAIAQAKQILGSSSSASKPKFAEGGLVGNRTTTKKDDKIDAKLSEGEYVIKSEVVKTFGVEFFDKLNGTKKNKLKLPLGFAGGGVVPSMTTINKIDTQMDYTQMKEIFKEAVSEIHPIVSVQEINDMQTRVAVKENIAIQ